MRSGCVLKSAWQEHSQELQAQCKRALFTESHWVLRRSLVGGCVVGAFSNLLGRSAPRSCVYVPWADMVAAQVFFSAWQAQCKRALFTEPHWVLRRSLVGGCVLGAFSNLLGRSTPRSCVHVPWADMLAAQVFFSAWQAQCKRAPFTEPHWVLRRSLVGGCVLGAFSNLLGRSTPRSCVPCYLG